MALMSPSNISIAFQEFQKFILWSKKMYFMVLFESLIILDNNLQSYIIDSLNYRLLKFKHFMVLFTNSNDIEKPKRKENSKNCCL